MDKIAPNERDEARLDIVSLEPHLMQSFPAAAFKLKATDTNKKNKWLTNTGPRSAA